MNIVCIGGGPAGLYFALLMKKQDPANEITVIERNRPYDTFGWGVVFSDQTLGNLVNADEPTAKEILQSFNHWDDIDVHFKGRTVTSGGHGFCGIGRKRLLNILQHRCEALGVLTTVFGAGSGNDNEPGFIRAITGDNNDAADTLPVHSQDGPQVHRRSHRACGRPVRLRRQ